MTKTKAKKVSDVKDAVVKHVAELLLAAGYVDVDYEKDVDVKFRWGTREANGDGVDGYSWAYGRHSYCKNQLHFRFWITDDSVVWRCRVVKAQQPEENDLVTIRFADPKMFERIERCIGADLPILDTLAGAKLEAKLSELAAEVSGI